MKSFKFRGTKIFLEMAFAGITLVVIHVVCLIGLTRATAPNPSIPQLKLLGDLNFNSGSIFMETEIGGISAIAFDPSSNELIALTDDRGNNGTPRFYTFKLNISKSSFNLTPIDVTAFLNIDGVPFPAGTIDPEGISITSDKTLLVSSEGDIRYFEPRINPGIYEFKMNGQFIQKLNTPKKFRPESYGTQKTGIRHNLGLTSLTISPDHKFLFSATENALIQDDSEPDFNKGSLSRIIEYKVNSDNNYVPNRELIYPVNSVPLQNDQNAKQFSGTNGLVELLAIRNNQLFSLERAAIYSNGEISFKSKLFKISLIGATDVSKDDKLSPNLSFEVTKELVLDLSEVIDQLTPGYQNIENMEAMTIGPRLANGNLTLILATDNHFKSNRRTQFLAFEILE